MQELVSPFERVVIDMGTGDGLFVYRSARANPHQFFIGIDANRRPLEKLSEKIYRKPAKGGLPNASWARRLRGNTSRVGMYRRVALNKVNCQHFHARR